MRLNRKIMICVAALAGLVTASAVHAQKKVCEHIGKWEVINGRIVCSGTYLSGDCVWTDDCRVNVE